MPTPTGQRRTPRWKTARPAASFEATATAVSSMAMPSWALGAKGFSIAGSTFMPTVTKNTGTRRSATGLIRSSTWARRSVLARISPAANAPMMVASPMRSARAARASAKTRE